MAIFKCKMCGGTIEFQDGATVGVCDSCGTKQTLPRLDSDRKTNLYDRANHFRRNNEFDKAMSIYENILNEDQSDAEAYWSIVLCRYGIEYVEDPATHRCLPTVNRAQFTSIFDDEDYKSAMQNADALQRTIYEDEAKAINEIQKGILEISAKEEPFDVFICYKETDANGRRTPDSVLATDLYHQLTNEGFKVFFSRITLEDKLGQEYEPYIFAALNSAKAMVVLGTRPEHFNAVWVKNEWSRYLALIKAGAKKTLIPAYRDMDPYDLPDEFSHLQAQDMSKLGFMQDLIRGIKKLVKTDEPKQTIRETIVTPAPTAATAPLLRRAFMFLEDGEWQSANEYCEKVLDAEPENAEAYLGKLMAELKVRKREDLKNQPQPFDDRNNYRKALRFADAAQKSFLSESAKIARDRYADLPYQAAMQAKDAAGKAETWFLIEKRYNSVAESFIKLGNYKDSPEQAEQCRTLAMNARKERFYNESVSQLIAIDTDVCSEAKPKYLRFIQEFEALNGWKDSAKFIEHCKSRIEEIEQKEKVQAAQRKKRVIITLIVIAAAALIGTGIGLWFTVVSPMIRYKKAQGLYESGQYEEAIEMFSDLRGYQDSMEKIQDCKYKQALALYETGAYDDALDAFIDLNGYRDSTEQITHCLERLKEKDYDAAIALYESGKYEEALAAFEALDGYKDSAKRSDACREPQKIPEYEAAVALYLDGKYEEAIEAFTALDGFIDSNARIEECKTAITDREYDAAVELYRNGRFDEAIDAFETLNGYKDSAQMIEYCRIEITASEYNAAAALYDSGRYEEALWAFEALNGYADSKTRIVQCKEAVYTAADELYQNGQYAEAFAAFTALHGFRDSNMRLRTILTEHGNVVLQNIEPGMTVYYGFYEQDKDLNNGEEPIEWIVLKKEGSRLLLLSRYALDCQQYAGETWEQCKLRQWLNDTFLKSAFDDADQKRIINVKVQAHKNPSYETDPGKDTTDKLFLLSISEVTNQIGIEDILKCEPTAWAKKQGVSYYGKTCIWWLRTPGLDSRGVACVNNGGGIYYSGVDVYNDDIGVRPAMWINLG